MDLIGTKNLRDLLLSAERRHGSREMLVHEAADGSITRFTYHEFTESVRHAAAGFSALGIAHGDAVVVHLPNVPEFLQAWFGLSWLGAVMVPSNTANTATELLHVAGFSDAVATVTVPAYRDLVNEVAKKLPAVKHRLVARTPDVEPGEISFGEILRAGHRPPDVPVGQEDVSEFIFTSGTTSRPKAVMLTHANALRDGERSYRISAVETSDRLMTALPLFHMNAQSFTVLSAITVGAAIVLLEEYRATKFWEQVRRHEATALSLVAMQLRTLLAQPPRESDLDHRVRRTFYALNVSNEEKTEFEQRYGLELINGYGLTETATVVTAAPVFGEKHWPSIGLPAFDREVRVVDTDGNDCPPGTPGEILVSGTPGRTLMKGYYKDPDATARALRDGWLHTGDNGYFDDDGFLYFFDRAKDVIKRAGENVSATEVETTLLRHPAVQAAAVIGVPDPIRDEAVMAFVVLNEGAKASEDELRAHCATTLAAFKVPTILEFRDDLPRTSIGKVSKKELREGSSRAGTRP